MNETILLEGHLELASHLLGDFGEPHGFVSVPVAEGQARIAMTCPVSAWMRSNRTTRPVSLWLISGAARQRP